MKIFGMKVSILHKFKRFYLLVFDTKLIVTELSLKAMKDCDCLLRMIPFTMLKIWKFNHRCFFNAHYINGYTSRLARIMCPSLVSHYSFIYRCMVLNVRKHL